VRSAAEHGAATDRGDHEGANAAHDRLMRALTQLRGAPDRGRFALTGLLSHEDPSVRCWAATHLLPVDEHTATHALEILVSESRFDASIVLREWKAGRLKLP
jgi:hypothetical protein